MPTHFFQPTKEELLKYEPIVKAAARRFGPLNSVLDKDDLEQEYWAAIIKHWDEIVLAKNEEHRLKLVKTITTNKTRYHVHFWARRPDSSWYSNISNLEANIDEETEEYTEFLNREFEEMDKVSAGSLFDTPEEGFFGQELLGLVKEFVNAQRGELRVFFKEYLNPSEETTAWWNATAATTVKNKFELIPYAMLSEHLFGTRRTGKKALRMLRDWLVEQGYERVAKAFTA